MTISKSNFFVITITLLTLLFLFQFTNMYTSYTSKATINRNAEQTIVANKSESLTSTKLFSEKKYEVAIVGDSSQFSTNMTIEWCTYVKLKYNTFSSIKEFCNNTSKYCKYVILSGTMVQTPDDILMLNTITSSGINLIFTTIPSIDLISSSTYLQNILGINQIKEKNHTTDGITVYEGILLGGQYTYKHFKKKIPYFSLKSGTKTYIVSYEKNQGKNKIKNESLPPLLWRNQYKHSFIFVSNCDFFKDHTGLGLLTGMLSEANSYLLYPVINAQSVVFQNFPYLSNENSKKISKKYFYQTKSLCENVLWPDIVSILNSTNDTFTGIIAPELEYNDNSTFQPKSLFFYLDQTEKLSGELGVSGDQIRNDAFYYKKLQKDSSLFQKEIPSYHFTIFSPGKMPQETYDSYLKNAHKLPLLSDIHTLLLPKENKNSAIASYYTNDIIALTNTIDGFSHKPAENLYMRSIQTALGYSNVSVDFSRVLYPNSSKDDWTKLSKKFSSCLNTYWKPFRKSFSQVIVSEADQRTRQFLTLNYSSFRQENNINISISNFKKSASFILNLSNENIEDISGGEFKEIEKNRYLINASQKNLTVTVAADDK